MNGVPALGQVQKRAGAHELLIIRVTPEGKNSSHNSSPLWVFNQP